MSRWEKTETLIEIEYKIECKSNLFVGSGYEIIAGDPEKIAKLLKKIDSMNPVQQNLVLGSDKDFVPVKLPNEYQEKAYIPGSTIKGLSRSRMEMNSKKRGCFSVFDEKLKNEGNRHRSLFNIGASFPKMNPKCWICKLYGSTKPEVGKGLISFSDAVLHKGDLKTLELKDHGTEYLKIIPKGSELRGTITMRNMTSAQEAMVLQSLGMVTKSGTSHKRLLGYSKYRIKRDGHGNLLELGSTEFKIRWTRRYSSNNWGIPELVSPDSSGLKGTELRNEYRRARVEEYRTWQMTLPFSKIESFDEVDQVQRGGLGE